MIKKWMILQKDQKDLNFSSFLGVPARKILFKNSVSHGFWVDRFGIPNLEIFPETLHIYI